MMASSRLYLGIRLGKKQNIDKNSAYVGNIWMRSPVDEVDVFLPLKFKMVNHHQRRVERGRDRLPGPRLVVLVVVTGGVLTIDGSGAMTDCVCVCWWAASKSRTGYLSLSLSPSFFLEISKHCRLSENERKQ